MGGGAYDVDVSRARAAAAAAAGTPTFAHSTNIKSGRISATAHELLDPKQVAGPTSPFAGQVMREVVITDEHPNPTPIALVLDVTGSNIRQAEAVHAKLPQLFGVLQRGGYVEDPQILIAATGDARKHDRVPLQVGQFESDIRIDAQVEAVYLEGLGGGGGNETYELAAYFLARHTHLEPWHNQGRKGYVFFIGDEKPYDAVAASNVQDLIGDKLGESISTEDIFEELKEQYEVFFLFQAKGSYTPEQVMPTWRALLGDDRVLSLENPDAVIEVIAGILGQLEGGLDFDDIEADLRAIGADSNAIRAAGKTLAKVGGGTGGAVAKTDGSLPEDDESDTGTARI